MKLKPKVKIVLYSAVVVGIFGLSFSACYNNFVAIHEKRAEIKKLKVEYDELLSVEDKLNEDVIKLQDSEYAAKYAREKYLYTKEGEIIIDLSKNKDDE